MQKDEGHTGASTLKQEEAKVEIIDKPSSSIDELSESDSYVSQR